VLSYLLLVLLLSLVILRRFLPCLLSSCDHDSDKLREILRNLTFPLSTFPRRDQTKARANNVGPCGSAFVSTFVLSISSLFLSVVGGVKEHVISHLNLLDLV
jgi:hypothetical protein